MNKNSKVVIFFIILLLLPLKLPAQDPAPFGDTNATISMDLQEANLKDVLKIFSIQSGINFIASEPVQDRKITLFLDKVAVKEAMDKLFKANNLTYELDEGAKIFIVKDWGAVPVETVTKIFYLKYATVPSSPLITEKSNQISSVGTAGGGGGGGKGGGGPPGGVAPSGSGGSGNVGIIEAVRKNISRDGSVTEDYRTNSLIVRDIPSRMPVIEKLIASLDVPAPQVMLEVEMLDVSKNTVDKLGFDFGQTPLTMVLTGASLATPLPFASTMYRNLQISKALTSGSINFSTSPYTVLLDFLRTRTDTKYLARPRLLTLNNETAEVYITKDEIVGREDTTTTTSGVTTTASTFKRSTDLALTREGTGIFLRVTPQINSERNEVTMVINPKSSVSTLSSLSTTTNQQADVEVRSTKSIVKVKDGETVVLGGIIHNDKQVTIKKLPLLGDIPLIGAFFRHKNQTKDIERELIIFITPHIVKDTNVELAQAKKTSLLTKEQITIPSSDRKLAIDASLNSFEKVK